MRSSSVVRTKLAPGNRERTDVKAQLRQVDLPDFGMPEAIPEIPPEVAKAPGIFGVSTIKSVSACGNEITRDLIFSVRKINKKGSWIFM